MKVVCRAAWVLPIAAPPIPGGWVAVEDGRVAAVGSRTDEHPAADDVVDLGSAVILPGLVNTHTHLELSPLQGMVPPSASMPAWASRLIAVRGSGGGGSVDSVDAAIRGARAAGTCLVGDVGNTLAAYAPLSDSPMAAAIFLELLGFNASDPGRLVEEAYERIGGLMPIEWLRPVAVPHAPYSVSPDLFRSIAKASGQRPVSVHLAESSEEVQFLRDGSGAWRELLERLGAWSDRWIAPACSPIEYLDRLGLVSDRLLAVHCVQATGADLRRLASAGATVVTCPRSNAWTGAGAPPVGAFYASGVRVAIGTDSLASVDDLSIFAELAAVHRLAPAVPASILLESATRQGADALGFGRDYGTIEAGKRAELIAVRVPSGIRDVEEYLVSGIEPDRVTWLNGTAPGLEP